MALLTSSCCCNVLQCSGNFELDLRTPSISFFPTFGDAMFLMGTVFQGEYIYIGAAVFTIVFCIIEMDKPDQPHNFEPQIYNMERGARDKLISDYNTMDIWEFNEKYGDLWDFTVKNDDITKR